VVSLSENILDLNKGIFFYGFFFSVLLMQSKSRSIENKATDIGEAGNPERLITV
jgi:hypothetical protein